jgi:alpha-N-acetylglucosamine transferase
MLDSDSVIQQHMDELFFLPPAPVALPRAYWLSKPTLGSYFMLIQPSTEIFRKIQSAIQEWAGFGIYDMEIVTRLFGDTCMRLPHRPYALLSGEFKSSDHSSYMGENQNWNGTKVINETKMIHFSDHPLTKPWEATWTEMQQAGPRCIDPVTGSLQEKCDDREAWFSLYNEFRERRKVCWMTFSSN